MDDQSSLSSTESVIVTEAPISTIEDHNLLANDISEGMINEDYNASSRAI
jgi:hypothetical protein